MNSFFRIACMVLVGFVMLLLVSTNFPVKAGDAPPQVRALWVDAFRPGIKTPDQVDKLIQDAINGNINTLIVQVRRRGDAYYNQSIEPRTEDPDLTPGFDALQYLIEKAHANGIEVHAWLNTLVAWNRAIPPKDPNHVWNLHGPKASEKETWVSYYRVYDNQTKSWSPKPYFSFYLDPGNPEVIDYTTQVYLNIVKNYDIDGIHLDYSRYSDREFGYNPTSLARYKAQYGTDKLPEPDEPNWLQWKREQTANLMRKIYLGSIALKPKLKVSSAVITWGEGPVGEGGWEKSTAYSRVCQDWRGWLQEGIIDMVVPMNYYSEWKNEQQNWYNQWIEWEKDNQYGRQIVVGPGIFMQYIEQSFDQIRRAQAPSAKGNTVAGVALYAYGASNLYSSDDYKESVASRGFSRQPYRYVPETNDWFFALLSQGGGYTDPVLNQHIDTKPVFSERAVVPDMPWKSQPVNGFLMGNLPTDSGKPFDHVKITVKRFLRLPHIGVDIPDNSFHREVYTDGSGWFGLVELPPGFYQIIVEGREPDGSASDENANKFWVQPGLVTQIDGDQIQ